MTVHHEAIVPGVTADHDPIHEDLAKWWNRAPRLIPCEVGGVADNTAMIEDFMDNATPGDPLVLPRGPIGVNEFTVSKMLNIRGAGRFGSWFVPLSDPDGPLITVDVTIDSGHGIFGNYGTTLEGFGIDRSDADAGPCMHITPNSAHVTLRDVLCSFGTKGLEHHGPNALFDGLYLWDSSDCMLDMDETGLELTMQRVFMAANVANVDAYWRLTIGADAAGGQLGGIYGGIVVCRSDPAVSVNSGVVMSAPSLTEIPSFLQLLVVDNVNGGGPAIDLDHVQSVGLAGWANGTAGAVRMDGCAGIQVGMRTRGGTHTYEFVGDATNGFRSRSEVFTGPAYKFTGTAPTADGWDADDWVAGATTIAQVTNNPHTWFDLAKRTWKSLRLQGMLRQREAGASPPQGFGTMAAGVLTVSHPNVQTNTRVDFWRETTGLTGLPGELQHDVADNVANTSFKIKSTSLTDTGRIGWRFHGDAD
jgi:hypothetical protein